MNVHAPAVACLGILVQIALAGPLGAETRLRYVGRYVTQSSYHDHLMAVEQVGDRYALVSSNLDIVIVDLDALPAGGTQTYVDRLAGLDVTNTVTRPDGYVYANLRMGGIAVVFFDEASATLTHLGEVAEPGVYYEKPALAGDLLYVPAHAFGLRIFSLADPGAPSLLGSIEEGFADAFAVAVDGDFAYVADGAGGLKVVDVADPSAPVIIAGETVDSSVGTAEDVLVFGEWVYTACGGAGIARYPAGGVEGRVLFDTPGCARQLAAAGARLLLADVSGVHVYDVDAAGNLTRIAGESGQRRSAGGEAVTLRLWNGVDAWGDDRILAADWDSMDVYELVDPAADDQPDVTASTHRIRFAPSGGSAIVRITNTGCGPLTISDISGAGSTFSLSHASADLPPGAHLDLRIDYAGGQPGETLVLIHSDDPDENPLPIQVYGDTEYLDPGEAAVPFSLESWTFDHERREFEYGQFDLGACGGKVVFFQVFGVGCPACLPTIADIENTIVGTYEDDPRVVTAIVSQVDPPAKLETFWSNLYLRGRMLYDPTGEVGGQLYQQPYGGVPFSRGWIIGPDQTVVLPQFGYPPQKLLDTIDGLLAGMPHPADLDGDGDVDVTDFLSLLAAWGPCPDPCPPACPGDVDNDCAVGVTDLLLLLAAWG